MRTLGRRMLLPAVGVVLVGLLLTSFALLLLRSQEQSRAELEERFALRGTLAARFTESYVTSLVETERRQAIRRLASRDVDASTFQAVATSLDFQAALLLDSEGRVIHALPADPDLPGTAIASRYDHLSVAVGGEVGISNRVESAVEREPVVAFAVPFQSVEGRRVFSGAFGIERTPIGAYLENALPIADSSLFVIDRDGAVVAAKDSGAATLAARDPALARAAGERARGEFENGGETWYFATAVVAGTPWRVVVATPTSGLLAPISGPEAWLPWTLFFAFAIAACAALVLLLRTASQRRLLAAANVRLAARNHELHELDRLKDEFVALVSHELRTPLTSIIGYVRVLLRGRAGDVPEKHRELLEIVERNAQRLVALVGDLLFASKVDAGKLELEADRLSLAELARQSVESALPVAREREVALDLDAEDDVELVGDRARLSQLLDNLVSNAVKFSKPGGAVKVRLSTAGGEAVLEVEDSGIGIPEAEQAQLFERFFRASTATEREIQGSGLGLSVARTIVELHGGTIGFTSREGHGTTFRVTLPISSTAEPALAA